MSTTELQLLLCAALRDGKLDQVTELLNAGAQPNWYSPGAHDLTPMDEAIMSSFLPGMEALYAAGADLNFSGEDGTAPLMTAAMAGEMEIGRWLLDRGADVDRRSKYDDTALSFAVREARLAFADMLLQICPRLRSEIPEMASLAINRPNVEVTKWLLRHGASPDTRTRMGSPWLMTVVGSHPHIRRQIVDLLIAAGADVNQTTFNGGCLLHSSAVNGWTVEFARLLRAGANPDLGGQGNSVRTMVNNWRSDSEIRSLLEAWDASRSALCAIEQSCSGDVRPL